MTHAISRPGATAGFAAVCDSKRVAGLPRLGPFIKFIPFPVTVVFTASIAMIMVASQIREGLGLSPRNESWELLGNCWGSAGKKLPALRAARDTVIPAALALPLGIVVMIVSTHGLKRPFVRYAATVDDALAMAHGAAPAPAEAA